MQNDECCPTHEGQELKFYCEKCSKIICAECIVEEHQNCPTKRFNVICLHLHET